MANPTISVLIPSYQRTDRLVRALLSLKRQTLLPDEVFVVYQGDDVATKNIAELISSRMPYQLKVLHCPEPNIVAAENMALSEALGEIIAMTDDDAKVPKNWLQKIVRHYENPKVGAVGGPVINFHPNGKCFKKRNAEPTGHISWLGAAVGNAFDQPLDWTKRPPITVSHLMGGNMSFRRAAVKQFETALKPYWMFFELDACLQVNSAGYLILFDFSNPIRHFPKRKGWSNRAGLPDDMLTIDVYNRAYNRALVLSKHTSNPLQRFCRFIHTMCINSVNCPGILFWPVTSLKYKNPIREFQIAKKLLGINLEGWRNGRNLRSP